LLQHFKPIHCGCIGVPDDAMSIQIIAAFVLFVLYAKSSITFTAEKDIFNFESNQIRNLFSIPYEIKALAFYKICSE
jgi:hypothetical protein